MMRIAACIVGAATILSGCASSPEPEGWPVSDAEAITTARSSSAGVEVCELVGRDSIVRVMACDEGTRYTLCTLEGATVARDLDAEGLKRLRPDLDPAAMQADWGRGPLMMVTD